MRQVNIRKKFFKKKKAVQLKTINILSYIVTMSDLRKKIVETLLGPAESFLTPTYVTTHFWGVYYLQ